MNFMMNMLKVTNKHIRMTSNDMVLVHLLGDFKNCDADAAWNDNIIGDSSVATVVLWQFSLQRSQIISQESCFNIVYC